ncbi:MAG: PepSY domain-containing protein [Gammaproteobacteria bacterium]
MRKTTTTASVLPALFIASTAMAGHGHHGDGSLNDCLKAASAIKDGFYAKVEYLSMTQKGVKTYEIEIHDKNGIEWELMCDTTTGNIYEVEREVDSPDDPLFKKHMKVDKEAAGKTALELYPGKLVHTEYEIEANGDASYEFDIYDRPGTTYKVEVDAASGAIVEVAIEKWDIGRETEEE